MAMALRRLFAFISFRPRNAIETNKEDSTHIIEMGTPIYEDSSLKLTPFAACFNLIILMVGTSMVAAPHAFSLTTPYMGVAMQFVLGFISWISAICIFNSSCAINASSFSDLGNKLFKDTIFDKFLNHLLITFPLIAVLLGSLASYIVISSNIMSIYVNLPLYLIKTFFCIIVIFLGAINSFNGMKFISYFAFCSFVSIIAMVLVVTFEVKNFIHFDPIPFSFSNFLQGIPILAIGLNGHMGLPGMSSEMTPRNQSRVIYYLFFGILTVIVFNCLVGFFPSMVYGYTVSDDIVKQLSQTFYSIYSSPSIIMLVVQIILGCVIVMKTPLIIFPLKEIILDRNNYTVSDYSLIANLLCSMCITIVGGLIAIFLPNLSETLNTVASIGSLLITGVTPAILSLKTEKGITAMIRGYFILVCGIVLLIVNVFTIVKQYS